MEYDPIYLSAENKLDFGESQHCALCNTHYFHLFLDYYLQGIAVH